jgi:hypothetical protein
VVEVVALLLETVLEQEVPVVVAQPIVQVQLTLAEAVVVEVLITMVEMVAAVLL